VVSSARLLGFTLDNKLSHDQHIVLTCAKLAGVNAMLLKLKLDGFPRSTLVDVYRSLFVAYLNYCGSIVFFARGRLIRKLQVLSNKAIRIICSLGRRDSATECARELNILPVFNTLQIAMLKFVFSQTVATSGRRAVEVHVASSNISMTRTRSQAQDSLSSNIKVQSGYYYY
jgi:hypothetical protein